MSQIFRLRLLFRLFVFSTFSQPINSASKQYERHTSGSRIQSTPLLAWLDSGQARNDEIHNNFLAG